MRNISFMLTRRQVRDRTKTVTRRLGWEYLKPGEHLSGCEKCQGRRHGEPLVRLCEIVVVTLRRERLDRMLVDPEYGQAECEREGFPEYTPEAFVDMFCATHHGCTPATIITRIEFGYIDPA